MFIQPNNTYDAADSELIAQFTAFMVKVVTSAKIDFIRRQRHTKWEIPVDKLPVPQDVMADTERWQSDVREEEFFFAEEQISDALSDIPSLRRRILELSFIDGLSAMEIAEMLGCSIKFVYNQKHAALKKLRDTLLKGGELDE